MTNQNNSDVRNDPNYEAKRLEILHSYRILNSARESRFDDLTSTIADLLNLPYAKVGFIDDGRIWYKSSYGLNAFEGAIEGTIAKIVLENPHEITVIRNLAADPRITSSNALTEDPHIRSAACVPIVNLEGYVLGMLCVFDTKERDFSAEDIAALSRVARQVVELMDSRREADILQETLRAQQEELRIKSTSDRIARSLVNSVQTKENLHSVINKFIQSTINEFGWWGGQAWFEEEDELRATEWIFLTSAPSSLTALNKHAAAPIPNISNEQLGLDRYSASDALLCGAKDLTWHPAVKKLEHAGAREFVLIDATGPTHAALRIVFILPSSRAFSANSKKVLENLHSLLPQVVRRARGAEELAYRATHDSLTGLLNRRGLEEIFPQSVSNLATPINRTVFFFDLDKFKEINDQFGHAVGDEFLIEISKRLIESSRPVDSIARIGGDEFIIVAQGFDSEEALNAAANRFLENLSKPFTTIEKINLHPRVSVGIAQWRTHEQLAAAISHADARMYEAKARGGQQASIDYPTAVIRSENSSHVIAEIPRLSIQEIVNLKDEITSGFFVSLTPPVYAAPRIMHDAAQHICDVIIGKYGEKVKGLPLIVETPGFKRSDRQNLESFFDAMTSLCGLSEISYCFDTRTGNLDSSNFARELVATRLVKASLGNFGAGNNEINLLQDLTPTHLLVSQQLLSDSEGMNEVSIRLLVAISKAVDTPLVIFEKAHINYMPILSQSVECLVIKDKDLGKDSN